MKESGSAEYKAKSSKNDYVPHVHMTWGGVVITFLAGVAVFFLAKYFSA